MTAATPKQRPNGRIIFGLMLAGTGRAVGFEQFGATTEAFLASLAPLLGILIVLTGTLALSHTDHLRAAATFFLSAVCGLLAPVVIADVFCRRWGKEELWALYANILTSAQWLMVAVLFMLVPPASVIVALGIPLGHAVALMLTALSIYALWFHYFAARHVLGLSRGPALLVMAAVVFGTGVLLQLPDLVQRLI